MPYRNSLNQVQGDEPSFRAVGEESLANPNRHSEGLARRISLLYRHSEPTGEESLSSLTRDISLTLNMT